MIGHLSVRGTTVQWNAIRSSHRVATADFDRDGNIDAIVANYATNDVSVFVEEGTAHSMSLGNSPSRVLAISLLPILDGRRR